MGRGLIRPVNYSMNTYSIARAKFLTYCEIIMQLYDYCCCEILDSEPFEKILALLNFLLYGMIIFVGLTMTNTGPGERS